MTKEELINKLKSSQGAGDPEASHCNADDYLLEYINDADVTREFKEVERWYA